MCVAVDAFTLVSISIQRYLAICRPLLMLQLRSAQYSSCFTFTILSLLWILGLISALPNLFMHELCYLPTLERYKCERRASKYLDERAFIIIVDSKVFLEFVVNRHVHILLSRFLFNNSNGHDGSTAWFDYLETFPNQHGFTNEINAGYDLDSTEVRWWFVWSFKKRSRDRTTFILYHRRCHMRDQYLIKTWICLVSAWNTSDHRITFE